MLSNDLYAFYHFLVESCVWKYWMLTCFIYQCLYGYNTNKREKTVESCPLMTIENSPVMEIEKKNIAFNLPNHDNNVVLVNGNIWKSKMM